MATTSTSHLSPHGSRVNSHSATTTQTRLTPKPFSCPFELEFTPQFYLRRSNKFSPLQPVLDTKSTVHDDKAKIVTSTSTTAAPSPSTPSSPTTAATTNASSNSTPTIISSNSTLLQPTTATTPVASPGATTTTTTTTTTTSDSGLANFITVYINLRQRIDMLKQREGDYVRKAGSFSRSIALATAKCDLIFEIVQGIRRTRKSLLQHISHPQWHIAHHYHSTCLEHFLGHNQSNVVDLAEVLHGHLRIYAMARRLILNQKILIFTHNRTKQQKNVTQKLLHGLTDKLKQTRTLIHTCLETLLQLRQKVVELFNWIFSQTLPPPAPVPAPQTVSASQTGSSITDPNNRSTTSINSSTPQSSTTTTTNLAFDSFSDTASTSSFSSVNNNPKDSNNSTKYPTPNQPNVQQLPPLLSLTATGVLRGNPSRVIQSLPPHTPHRHRLELQQLAGLLMQDSEFNGSSSSAKPIATSQGVRNKFLDSLCIVPGNDANRAEQDAAAAAGDDYAVTARDIEAMLSGAKPTSDGQHAENQHELLSWMQAIQAEVSAATQSSATSASSGSTASGNTTTGTAPGNQNSLSSSSSSLPSSGSPLSSSTSGSNVVTSGALTGDGGATAVGSATANSGSAGSTATVSTNTGGNTAAATSSTSSLSPSSGHGSGLAPDQQPQQAAPAKYYTSERVIGEANLFNGRYHNSALPNSPNSNIASPTLSSLSSTAAVSIAPQSNSPASASPSGTGTSPTRTASPLATLKPRDLSPSPNMSSSSPPGKTSLSDFQLAASSDDISSTALSSDYPDDLNATAASASVGVSQNILRTLSNFPEIDLSRVDNYDPERNLMDSGVTTEEEAKKILAAPPRPQTLRSGEQSSSTSSSSNHLLARQHSDEYRDDADGSGTDSGTGRNLRASGTNLQTNDARSGEEPTAMDPQSEADMADIHNLQESVLGLLRADSFVMLKFDAPAAAVSSPVLSPEPSSNSTSASVGANNMTSMPEMTATGSVALPLPGLEAAALVANSDHSDLNNEAATTTTATVPAGSSSNTLHSTTTAMSSLGGGGSGPLFSSTGGSSTIQPLRVAPTSFMPHNAPKRKGLGQSKLLIHVGHVSTASTSGGVGSTSSVPVRQVFGERPTGAVSVVAPQHPSVLVGTAGGTATPSSNSTTLASAGKTSSTTTVTTGFSSMQYRPQQQQQSQAQQSQSQSQFLNSTQTSSSGGLTASIPLSSAALIMPETKPMGTGGGSTTNRYLSQGFGSAGGVNVGSFGGSSTGSFGPSSGSAVSGFSAIPPSSPSTSSVGSLSRLSRSNLISSPPTTTSSPQQQHQSQHNGMLTAVTTGKGSNQNTYIPHSTSAFSGNSHRLRTGRSASPAPKLQQTTSSSSDISSSSPLIRRTPSSRE